VVLRGSAAARPRALPHKHRRELSTGLRAFAILPAVTTYELLLLPGLDGTGSLYAEFERALPQSIRLRALAYPSDRALGYADLADLVREQLPTSGPWLLLGESFSGPLALRLAAERPLGLVGLVLVATFHRKPLALPAWLVPTLAFRVRPPRWVIRRLMFDEGVPERDIDDFYRALESVRPNVMARRAREALRVDETTSLATIDVPTLNLRAGADRLFSPKVHEALRRVMPELETEVIGDAPHLVLQRRPIESAQAIIRWCARLGE